MLTEPFKRKKDKTKPTMPALAEPESGGRYHVDDLTFQLWEDRFRVQGEQIAELTRTVRGFNGTPGVMERLGMIETSQTALTMTINAIHVLLTEGRAEPDEKKGFLTKDQLASMALGFMKPVLTAVVIWALLTFFPDVMAHIGRP